MCTGRPDVAHGGDNIFAQLALCSEIELLHLSISIICCHALERINGGTFGQAWGSRNNWETLRNKKAGNIVSRLRNIQNEIKRRLPLLPDITSGIALRIIKDAITTAENGFWCHLPGECNPWPDRLIISIDIGRGTHSIRPGDQLPPGNPVKVGPVVVCFREGRIDLIVQSEVQS